MGTDRYETELVFEHQLDGAEEDEGSVISGLEIAENRFRREQGEHLPADLQSGDSSISFALHDLLLDPEEEAWKAKHEAERERLIAQSKSGEHRNILILGHEMMRACVGDDGNFIEPEPGPAYSRPTPSVGFAVVQKRRRVPNITKR